MGWQYLLLILVLPLFAAEDTFFEGDLLFQDTVLAQQSPELFVRGADFKWPGGVVTYIFEANSRFTHAEKEVVRMSMDNIQDRTGCVEFVEVEREGGDVVLITKRGFGNQSGQGKCWAQLGRRGGTQAINLGDPGCFTTRVVTHELLHTLGVIHEHTRFDRDDYVQIISDNVAPEKMHNFDIRTWKETDHSDIPYDYKSVMHYDMYAFSKKPKKVTIQPHHKEFEGIGHYSEYMSGIDAIEVALAYGCALKPETVVEFVNDNVEILQTVQDKHTRQIEALMEAVAGCTCKAPWTLLATGCYLFWTVPMTYQEAKNFCFSKNFRLVEIESEEENTAIVQEIIKQKYQARKELFWMGLTDRVREGVFRWESSEKIPIFKAWGSGEPNNAGLGEDCTVFSVRNEWQDFFCDHKTYGPFSFYALCEKV